MKFPVTGQKIEFVVVTSLKNIIHYATSLPHSQRKIFPTNHKREKKAGKGALWVKDGSHRGGGGAVCSPSPAERSNAIGGVALLLRMILWGMFDN
ncbi:hypothetical protein R6Q59_036167 [Mikania micrantha]